jgi:hypothetical protein
MPDLHIVPGAPTIAVSSGKGGVGKTTTTVNLAVNLALRGRNVLIVDGDLAGPNVHLIGGFNDLKLGVVKTPGNLRIDLPVNAHGVRIATGLSLKLADAKVRVTIDDLIGISQFAEPADIVLADLPPGWTDHHRKVCRTMPDMIVMPVAATPSAISDHLAHQRAWRKEWTATVEEANKADRRRKLNLPTDPTFITVETMARFTGTLDGTDQQVTIRRSDALPADVVAEKVAPALSLTGTATVTDGANSAEMNTLADLILAGL